MKKSKTDIAFEKFTISLQKAFAKTQDTPEGWTSVKVDIEAARAWFNKKLTPRQVMKNDMKLFSIA